MNKNGFTLTEMSMVLIVIATLMAAITGAEGLRTQYNVRSIINDYNYYSGAIRTFKAIYGYLPGDFPSAGILWNTPSTNNCTNAAQPAGCNGNGDGNVIGSIFGYIRTWQHMALAGLISGNYNCNGTGCAAAPNGLPNTIPSLKIPGVSLEFRYYQSLNSTVTSIVIGALRTDATNYGLPTQTGGTVAVADNETVPAFNLLLVKGVDSKIDDGIANSGNILGLGTCSYVYTNPTGNDYILSTPYATCYLLSKWNE